MFLCGVGKMTKTLATIRKNMSNTKAKKRNLEMRYVLSTLVSPPLDLSDWGWHLDVYDMCILFSIISRRARSMRAMTVMNKAMMMKMKMKMKIVEVARSSKPVTMNIKMTRQKRSNL
jgi:hypothetical protein